MTMYIKSWDYVYPYWWNAYVSGGVWVQDDFGVLVYVGGRNQDIERE